MRSSRSSRSGLLAAAAFAMGLAPSTPTFGPVDGTTASSTTEQTRPTKSTSPSVAGVDRVVNAIFGRIGAGSRPRYPRPGWSVAEGKRRARKARNVARNRRAHRGAR